VDEPDEHRAFTGGGQSPTVRQTISCRLPGHVEPVTHVVSSGELLLPEPQQIWLEAQSCGPRQVIGPAHVAGSPHDAITLPVPVVQRWAQQTCGAVHVGHVATHPGPVSADVSPASITADASPASVPAPPSPPGPEPSAPLSVLGWVASLIEESGDVPLSLGPTLSLDPQPAKTAEGMSRRRKRLRACFIRITCSECSVGVVSTSPTCLCGPARAFQ
jgi:hypothetical protein